MDLTMAPLPLPHLLLQLQLQLLHPLQPHLLTRAVWTLHWCPSLDIKRV